MKANEVLEGRGILNCPECHCAIGDDWEYKDFSNKNLVICPQCKTEIDVSETIETNQDKVLMDLFLYYSTLTDGDNWKPNISKISKATGVPISTVFDVCNRIRKGVIKTTAKVNVVVNVKIENG